jgi:putative ABC transport system substrate-binding protein
MRRRTLLLFLGGAAVWPLAVGAQQPPKVYRVGFLTTGFGPAPGHEAFDAALANLGFQQGRNLVIERRYAGGDLNRLPALAADLVRANVEVIVTESTAAALAAKQATARIPIVITTSGDAVGSGLVASLARPGGNVTGTTILTVELERKRVELLREFKPDARRVAYLGNSQSVADQLSLREVQRAATAFGMDVIFVDASVPEALEPAFATMAAAGVDVFIASPSSPNTGVRSQIVGAAARYRLPAAYGRREFADAGGLISYGTSRAGVFGRAAVFVDKLLKGANPADLPVEQPRKFELVINLKTARALGLAVPRSLLVRADEVIK